MNRNDAGQAAVLIHALPYIQKFRGRTIVIKYGGSAIINDDLKEQVIRDIVLLSCVGIRVVLVHGGGPEIEAMLRALGKESRFVNGLRYTDKETMEVVQMVLCGKLNKDLSALIERSGGRAIGLSGLDGSLLKARLKDPGLGLVGEVETVDTALLDSLLNDSFIPVISTVARNCDDAEGGVLNVNADAAAAAIAAALGAEKLILMTDVPGVLQDLRDPDSLIQRIRRPDLDALVSSGVVSKGMIPKTQCCAAAIDGGVQRAHIIDGRVPHALLIELFTDEGIGTMIE
jgi:acetylglutamate kinase